METQFQKQHEVYFTHGTNFSTGRRFTLAVVIRKGETRLAIAECAEGDQFSRKIGRKIAEARAIHGKHIGMLGTEDKQAALDFMHEYRGLLEPAKEKTDIV
jgi:hypothetical protein